MQIGSTGSCETPGKVQLRNAGRANDEVPENITFLGSLRPQNGHFGTVTTIYNNLHKTYSSYSY